MSERLLFQARIHHLAKDVEFADDYEDAFSVDRVRGVAAIADGVSSAIFSRSWADLLTRATVDEPPNLYDPEAFQAWLAARRRAWWEQIDVPRLPWNQQQKLQQVGGAYSTLLWMELFPLHPEATLEESHDGIEQFRLLSYALGDCCLFHVRDGQLLKTFPIEEAADFDRDPLSLCSVDLNRDHLLEFRSLDETCQAGDLLVLCTDAIGKWAVTRLEAGEPLDWESYWDLPAEDWRQEILELRRATQMRYDDATLVLLRVGSCWIDEAGPLVGDFGDSEGHDDVVHAALVDAFMGPEPCDLDRDASSPIGSAIIIDFEEETQNPPSDQ